jgi:peptide chain release factor 2
LRERSLLNDTVADVERMAAAASDAVELAEMADAEGDESLFGEIDASLVKVEADLDRLEFQRMMASPTDRANAILQINAGAGGTESCDWANMLLRMFTRWAEKSGMTTTLLDVLPGEETGVRNVVLQIDGPYAYGFLKAESGVHRLVRISPFDSAKRRHTSFASVYVVPEEDETVAIEINPADLRIDVFRASGAGGQHVNRTESAVRITHEPSGIVVSCQAERSQHKNRDKAMKVLAARLADLQRREQRAAREEIEAAKMGIAFGSQIRSYVLAPYRMVKDHRTGYESPQTDLVLDGDLDGFIRAWLLSQADAAADAS